MDVVGLRPDKYRAFGFNLVPVGPDKRPAGGSWKRWQTDKQTDADYEAFGWDASVATGVAAISGEVSDYLVALDLDQAPGRDSVSAILVRMGLPDDYPWVVKSPRGWHVWVRCPGLADALVAAGLPLKAKFEGPWPGTSHLELRWNGCYTILPPSSSEWGTYVFANGEPQTLPLMVEATRLLGLTTWKQVRSENHKEQPPSTGAYDAYIARALEAEAQALAAAPRGDRNNRLNTSALKMGSMAHAGAERGQCEETLVSAAMRAGLDETESQRTFASGWQAGVASPRTMPVQTAPRAISAQAETHGVRTPQGPVVTHGGRTSVGLSSAEATRCCLEDLSRRERGEVRGLPWPVEWGNLGRTLGPIERGTFTVVASRPSVGKTIFGSQIQAFLCDRGYRILYVTRELTPERLVRRHMVASGASMDNLKTGRLTAADKQAIELYTGRQRDWQVRYDRTSNTVVDIAWEAEDFSADLVIVDYLQRLDYNAEKEYAAITRLANELQDMTLATGTPVVCLCQLTRPLKGQEHRAPTMNETRGSGAVEERATNLILLHRKWITEASDQNKSQRIATVKLDTGLFIVAKNADGEADKTIHMTVEGSRMRIVESAQGRP